MNVFKSIICPVSTERIPENLVRIVAFFVSIIYILFILTGFLPLIIFVAYDFFVRAFNYANASPLFHIAKILLPLTGSGKTRLIDKAPKLFAARIGFFISLSIIIMNLFHLNLLIDVLAYMILLFSILEWAFNICAGCILYSWLIFPFVRSTSKV